MQKIAKKHADKLRFIIVGSINTVIDFSILFTLATIFNTPKELANFISTFVAFLFSFFANKKYTFKSTSKNLKNSFYYLLSSRYLVCGSFKRLLLLPSRQYLPILAQINQLHYLLVSYLLLSLVLFGIILSIPE